MALQISEERTDFPVNGFGKIGYLYGKINEAEPLAHNIQNNSRWNKDLKM